VRVSVLNVVEIAAVAAFAYSGAVTARKRGMDIVGVSALAIINGLAGGMVRDTLIDHPVIALYDRRLLVTCLVVATAVALLGDHINATLVEVIDAVGLGLFTVLGTRRALDTNVTAIAAVLLGAVTVAVGSLLRDVLAGDRPTVFYRSQLYVTASVIGSIAYVIGAQTTVSRQVLLFSCAALATSLRLAAWRFDWTAPIPGGRRPTQ
jgi:uncharacterized membrane protein YeiH